MHTLRPLTLASLLVLGLVASAQAHDRGPFPHHDRHNVYVMSNDRTANSIAVLKPNRVGALEKVAVIGTGGIGAGVGTTAPPPDPLGSQNEILVSQDGRWLFAVNAGSNQISVFRIGHDRLDLVDLVPSGGTYPVSLAQRGDALYVLNAADVANITAFAIDHAGRLTAIPGSTRAVGTQSPLIGHQPDVGTTPAQLQFSNDGQWLAVTVKDASATGFIELFAVDRRGRLASDPAITPSGDTAPFGFDFDRHGHLLVSEAAGSAASSYAIQRDGSLRAISTSVANGQAAACWLAVNRRFAYTANAGSNTLSGYRVGKDGGLSLIDDGVSADLGPGHAPTDLKFARDGRHLYVLSPGTGSIDSYAVGDDGSLVFLGDTPLFAALSGTQGLAVQ